MSLQRAIVDVPDDFEPEAYVRRGIKNSDCRSPVIFFQEDGDPFTSVYVLGKESGAAVWTLDLAVHQSAQNLMDYVDVGIQAGDWVYVSNCDSMAPDTYRDVARLLYSLQPNPNKFPRREYFRLFMGVQKPFDVNGTVNIPFPPLLLHSAVVIRADGAMAKLNRPMPVDDPLFTEAQLRHMKRREEGRDSDNESDVEDGHYISGMRFFRSTELYSAAGKSPAVITRETFVAALESGDVEKMKSMITEGEVSLTQKVKDGMTPLQYACSIEQRQSAIALLNLGADPNAPRESDGRPPLFMALEDLELAKKLILAGGDLFLKYEGYRLDQHPDTAPNVAKYAQQERLRA